MAIRDLLWACPECGKVGGLAPTKDAEVCTVCGTRFRRGKGAMIEAERPGQGTETRTPAEWVDRLPPIRQVLDATPADGPVHQERVTAQFAEGEVVIHHRGKYLNRIERFGSKREGLLAVFDDHLTFLEDDGTETTWPYDTITALQPSSSTLQVKARGMPLASFRFPNGSARFWEELLGDALRRHYRRMGKGEIIEFQPRITARP